MKTDFYPIRQWTWVSAAVGVGTAIVSGYTAIKQKQKAKELEAKNKLPTQETPQAIKEAEQMATNEANVGLPGVSLGQARKNIDRTTATALGRARDTGTLLAANPYIQQQANDANLNLDVADANARIQNRAKLMNQKNLVGQYQQNNFDWNQKQRYIDNAAAIRGLFGASNANANAALDRGIASVGRFATDYNGSNGLFGGSRVRRNGAPIYEPGYDENSGYSDFQTNY